MLQNNKEVNILHFFFVKFKSKTKIQELIKKQYKKKPKNRKHICFVFVLIIGREKKEKELNQ